MDGDAPWSGEELRRGKFGFRAMTNKVRFGDMAECETHLRAIHGDQDWSDSLHVTDDN